MQRLASDINVDCSNLAALSGTVVVKRATAAAGFDDVAAIDTAFNRMGIPMHGRKACYSSGDYNSMASNLAGADLAGKSLTAYERAAIGNIAGFDTQAGLRLPPERGCRRDRDRERRQPALRAGIDHAGRQRRSTQRRQPLPEPDDHRVTSGTVKVGDAFTIAGVNEVHHITKQDTGSLKTFRITAIVSGGGGSGVVQISPPIVAADSSPTDPELQYRNCPPRRPTAPRSPS
jgi:hypothetical protein